MTHHFLDAINTEYYNGSAWVDITNYVVGDIKGNNGLGGWKPDQRVAVLGTLNITLNNKGKLFSPMGGDAVRGLSTLTGFNRGAKIRIRGMFGTTYYTIWTGRIASIDSDDKNWGNEQTRLMAVDWMDVPSNYPMAGATIALNKRIDESMSLILARLSQQPESTDFDTGLFTFPAVFDNVQRKTMALSEFTKLANSELGYIYVRQDGTLVAENMLTRQGWRALDQLWIIPEVESYLLMEDGFFLLTEDGGKIVLDEGAYEDASIATDAEGYNILLGEDSLLNASIIRAHPVVTDTSLKVLYKLGTPLFIPSGKTSEFSAHYTDPSGLSQVSGTNMQVPAATTDYLANTLASGAGTNKTSDIVMTATYYGDTVYYSIANNATVGVYITFLQARGYGIYYGNSIESTVDDATSQSAYGYAPFQFDMKYQKDTYLADMYGLSVVEEYKTPKSRITKMNYLANLNHNHMMCFLVLTIGSLILGTEDRSGISNHYYITDRAFTIKQGGIINVEYGLKQNDSYLSGGLEPVTVEFGGYDTKDGIVYEASPIISTAYLSRSFSAWVYALDPVSEPNAYTIFSNYSGIGSGGFIISFRQTALKILFQVLGTTDLGEWESPANLQRNTWMHIVVTRDSTTPANKPTMYINGVSQTITEVNTQTSTTMPENGLTFVVGNRKSPSYNLTSPFRGKIFDPRIYNRILTAADVTTLYNAGIPDVSLVTDGLVFQAFSTYADRPLADGTVLTSADRLTENIVRAVGIPNGSPVIRDAVSIYTLYDLYDKFETDRAAGAVNGTQAEPIGGTRTVINANGNISIIGGVLNCATGSTPLDFLSYPSMSKAIGATLITKVIPSVARFYFGWTTLFTQAHPSFASFLFKAGISSVSVYENGLDINVGTITPTQEHTASIILRDLGAFYLIKGYSSANYILLYATNTINGTAIHPLYSPLDAATVFSADDIRFQKRAIILSPLASDSFNRADGAIGSTDGAGTPETGGSGLAWAADAGTFTIATNKAKASVLAGGIAITTVAASSVNVMVEMEVTRAAGDAGMILRYVDASNYVRAIHNGTNVQLVKVVAGTPTTLINTAAAHVAGARLIVSADLTKFRVYYNNAFIGTEQTISDAALQTSGKIGIYTGDLTNTFDNFVAWARGNEGQYADIDKP